MQYVIDVVELKSLNEIVELKDNWESVYRSDPQSHFFTSWVWLRSFFEATRHEWVVLAAKERNAQEYVAFFPLVIQKSSRGLIKTIHLGGFPLADYSGFICRPEYETEVSKSISTLIKDNLKWDRFRLDDIIGDRLELVSRFFPGDRYYFEQRYSTPCPYLSLPGSFEEYLASLGRSTRRTIRRRKRDIQMVEGYRVSDASQDDLDFHIDIILKLWRDRWGLEPEEFRSLFHRCFNNDCLWFRVLWLSDIPIAASLDFVDRSNKTYLGFLAAYDPNYQTLSPGTVLLSQSIEYAIEQGLETYDFLRGGEPYKYVFGAVDRFVHSAQITRKNFKNTGIVTIKQIRKTIVAEKVT